MILRPHVQFTICIWIPFLTEPITYILCFNSGFIHSIRIFSARLRSSDDSRSELRYPQRRILRPQVSQDRKVLPLLGTRHRFRVSQGGMQSATTSPLHCGWKVCLGHALCFIITIVRSLACLLACSLACLLPSPMGNMHISTNYIVFMVVFVLSVIQFNALRMWSRTPREIQQRFHRQTSITQTKGNRRPEEIPSTHSQGVKNRGLRHSDLFFSVPFCSVPSHSPWFHCVLFRSIVFCPVPLCSVLLCFVLSRCVLFSSVPFTPVPFHLVPFRFFCPYPSCSVSYNRSMRRFRSWITDR